jgi:magnesium transporter
MDGDGSGAIVNCAGYEEGRKVADLAIDDVGEFVLGAGSRFVWIGLHDPGEDLLRRVQHEFDLHELAVEDAHRAHQRPKLEEYGVHLFIVVRTAHGGGNEMEFGETHFFVGERFLVSVRHGASLPYASVRARCESTPSLLAKGPSFVLYALMDFVVDNYFPLLESVEEQVEELEDSIFAAQFDRGSTVRIYELKRDAQKLKRAVAPLIDVCTRLERFDLALIDSEVRPYFRDVHDHAVRVNERLDHVREMLTSILEANLSLMSVTQNEVMKRLAAWAAILAVPTMLAGIWGMNFHDMPELGWSYGYPTVLGAMACISGFLYWRLRKAGWL